MLRQALSWINIIAVGPSVFGLYFPRHRRRDLVAAYLGANVGVPAVASGLNAGTVGVGPGLKLVGVPYARSRTACRTSRPAGTASHLGGGTSTRSSPACRSTTTGWRSPPTLIIRYRAQHAVPSGDGQPGDRRHRTDLGDPGWLPTAPAGPGRDRDQNRWARQPPPCPVAECPRRSNSRRLIDSSQLDCPLSPAASKQQQPPFRKTGAS